MTDREYPDAVYAVAGVSDLAYQRLRRLPETATRTVQAARRAAQTWRETGKLPLDQDRITEELARLRQTAQRGAATLLDRAVKLQERATESYRRLVEHGEAVLNRNRGPVSAVVTVERESEGSDGPADDTTR